MYSHCFPTLNLPPRLQISSSATSLRIRHVPGISLPSPSCFLLLYFPLAKTPLTLPSSQTMFPLQQENPRFLFSCLLPWQLSLWLGSQYHCIWYLELCTLLVLSPHLGISSPRYSHSAPLHFCSNVTTSEKPKVPPLFTLHLLAYFSLLPSSLIFLLICLCLLN